MPAWLWAISVVALIKVIISMVWAIVVARNLSMGVAWHRFLAFFNIYFKREDSGRTALGALKPMLSDGEVLDLDEADPEKDTFGVGRVEDFSWKGWLDFSTCTECGRCQSQCPAWNTAKPLVPQAARSCRCGTTAFAKAPYLRRRRRHRPGHRRGEAVRVRPGRLRARRPARDAGGAAAADRRP